MFEPRRRTQRHCRPACRARSSRERLARQVAERIARLERRFGAVEPAAEPLCPACGEDRRVEFDPVTRRFVCLVCGRT
jgi:hypothetical protein